MKAGAAGSFLIASLGLQPSLELHPCGNSTFLLSIVKHAESVPHCALALARLMAEAGAPEGVYTNIFATHEQAARVIADQRVAAVTITGSERDKPDKATETA